MAATQQTRSRPSSGAVGSIVVNLLLLYAAHHVLEWRLPWITPAWSSVSWAIDLMLGVSIVVNVFYLLSHPEWLHDLAGAVSLGVATYVTWWVYAVFPFDLGSVGADDIARIVLLALLLATAIATVVIAVLGVLKLVRAQVESLAS